MRMTVKAAAFGPKCLLAAGVLALSACAGAERTRAAPSLAASPQPAAATVIVDEATLSEPGFVVVHATDAEGKPLVPGSIGAAPIAGGQGRNIAVPLTQQVGPGDLLIAMLHFDSGQPGIYEFGPASIAEDKPVMYQGKPVTAAIVLD
jgi:hypothetical protein